jgi:hypothetical protein
MRLGVPDEHQCPAFRCVSTPATAGSCAEGWPSRLLFDNVRYTALKRDSTLRPSAVCVILRLAAGRLDSRPACSCGGRHPIAVRLLSQQHRPSESVGLGRPDELADVGVWSIGGHLALVKPERAAAGTRAAPRQGVTHGESISTRITNFFQRIGNRLLQRHAAPLGPRGMK